MRVHPLGDSFEGGVEWFVNEVYGHYLSMDEGEVYKYCKLPNTFERIVLLQTSTLLKTTLKFTWPVVRFTSLSKVDPVERKQLGNYKLNAAKSFWRPQNMGIFPRQSPGGLYI